MAYSFRQFMERHGGSENERLILYHGTSIGNLSNILSHGLIPFPKKRAWQDDSQSSSGNASRQSYGGIYLTPNLMTAAGAGTNHLSGYKRGNPYVIVIIEAQPRSLVADEDDITYSVVTPWARNYNTNTWLACAMYFKWILKDDPDVVNQYRNEYVDLSIERLKLRSGQQWHPELEHRVRSLLSDLWPTVLERFLAYFPKEHGTNWKWDWERYWTGSGGKNDPPEVPVPQEAERKFREKVEPLTRTLKSLARPGKTASIRQTSRSLEPIGYHGRNHIVGVVVIKPCDREKDGVYEKVKVVYGILPDDFKRQYTERIGELVLDTEN